MKEWVIGTTQDCSLTITSIKPNHAVVAIDRYRGKQVFVSQLITAIIHVIFSFTVCKM